MKFDDLTEYLGEFGTYQKRMYIVLCLPAISTAIQMLSSVFILAIPDHRCQIPGLANDTYAVRGHYHQCLLNQTIPLDDEDGGSYEGCKRYHTGNTTECTNIPGAGETTGCEDWVYDMSTFQNTFVTVHDLICENKAARSHANMILFAGLLVGCLVFGLLGDIIGRKKTLIITVFLHIGGSIGQAFAPNFTVLVVLKFFTGASTIGLFLVAFVIGMELVGPSKRVYAGIIIELFWTIGLFVLVLLAYFIRYWNYLQMAISFPTIILLIYIWLCPESARWLLSRGRNKDAEEIIMKAAEVNKVTIPSGVVEQIELDEKQESFLKIFKSPIMIMRTFIIYVNWCVVSMVYYGLGLNVASLSGDIYLNFVIASCVEGAAYVACIILLNRVGRKILHCGTMILGGVACLCTIFTVLYAKPYPWTTTMLSMIGKFGASAAFAIIYVWSAEIFPTPMRNSGMGTSSMCARIGGMISPYIADLGLLVEGPISKALPLIVFGATAVGAGLLAIVLPETLNVQMPESVEDAERLGRGPNKNSEKKYYLNQAYGEDDKKPDEFRPQFDNITAMDKY